MTPIEAAVKIASEVYTTQLGKAIQIADTAHRGQKYGDGEYFQHLMEVDRLVVQIYADPNRAHNEQYSKHPNDDMDKRRAVAYLHDVLEDTRVTIDDLVNSDIDEDVIHAVDCMTKKDGQCYMVYLDIVCSNELARKVKICDTLANLMNSIKEGNVKRINKYTNQYKLLNEGF